MKVSVLLPSYNEEKNIGDLIKGIRHYVSDIIVVDDGSSDRTGDIASREGAFVIRHRTNKGKGASLKDGFAYVKELGYDAVIVMDADGQHKPEDIPLFIEAGSKKGDVIIIGDRMQDVAKMPFLRRMTNRFTSFLISKSIRQSVPDSQCGFRLIKRRVLDNLKLSTSNYDTESEMLIEAARNNFQIISLPITTIYNGQHSNINPIVDTIRFFRLVLRSFLRNTPTKVGNYKNYGR
ncbi:MAG: glycosyltransferase family 2 protein [Candidatus Omnitrophica bacterium]|nr:glycosyltransferase family 2 protein [Candidatus Omnitrophota bacterium]